MTTSLCGTRVAQSLAVGEFAIGVTTVKITNTYHGSPPLSRCNLAPAFVRSCRCRDAVSHPQFLNRTRTYHRSQLEFTGLFSQFGRIIECRVLMDAWCVPCLDASSLSVRVAR